MHFFATLIKDLLADALTDAEKGAYALARFPAHVLHKDDSDVLYQSFLGVQEAAKAMDKALAVMRAVAADQQRERVPAKEVPLSDVQDAINRIGGAGQT